MALSMVFLKFLIQNMTRCTKNDSKTDFFQKHWSKNFLSIKRTFSGTILAKKHKTASFDVFTLKIDQIIDSLRSTFPTTSVF